ncbi:CRP/FNR family transcriptional regulator [Hydrogenivirga caldilitoris]|uniref:CRP/FNR family transcriptional regulator n=1 Tax=Hydrogenivirga caldilitoris TaxID=246264 RepID=A0A497XVZ7_9AQUI|nr:Crp/Fnr family transcriptional regulator [Hydrogenivirga caldilitoris]RLJ71332.1 CRP/FNR family transcriptional regulator [Hydrogenivirga caldilitoris]
MIKEEKLWYLKNLDILSGLSEEELKFLDDNSVGLNVKKGTTIYSPEEKEEFLYFVKRGSVRLYKVDSNGKEITFAILGAGDIFGGISPYDRDMYGEFAVALEDTFICLVNKRVFFSRMSRNPTIMLRLNKFLGLMTYELELRIEELVAKPVLTRLASLLLRLQDRFGDPEGDIKLSLSHRELASLIGATREATTIALNELKDMGAIEIGRKKIKVISRKLLEELSTF